MDVNTKVRGNQRIKTKDMILCSIFTALIIVGAFIRVPIPYVPFTLQVMFTNLAGLILGSRLGALSVLVYVLLGLSGVPVFTAGGGISYIFSPTFGYLIGFVIGAYAAGKIVERNNRNELSKYLWASAVNLFIVYFIGVLYMLLIKNLYLGSLMTYRTAIIYGFLIPLPGDIVTVVFSSMILKKIMPSIRKGQ